MLMEYTARALPYAKTVSFFRAVRDDDSFTVFWELAAHSPSPVPFESIRRTFGADPKYLSEVLHRLQHFGVVTKTGRQWTACHWAKLTLEYLEEIMKDVQIEVAQPDSSEVEIYTDALQVATHDGFWMAATSQVTAGDRRTEVNPRTDAASADDAIKLGSEMPTRAQNEARSHDYK